MALHLTLRGAKFVTVVSAYAPAITKINELKDKFYEDLRTLLAIVPKACKLIGLGDFSVPSRQTTLPRKECWVPTELPDSTTTASASYWPVPSSTFRLREGNLDGHPIVTLTAEARPSELNGDKANL
nr:unnamed protein product [Spirometra erinaceieuropaei]